MMQRWLAAIVHLIGASRRPVSAPRNSHPLYMRLRLAAALLSLLRPRNGDTAVIRGPDEVFMAYDKKHPDDTLSEEASALGKRVKGAAKDGIGAVTGNERLEREGEQENVEGRARQATNNVFDETDGVRGASVRNSDS